MTQTSKASSAPQSEGGTPIWRAANCGNGKRIWFVVRGDDSNAEYVEGRGGQLLRFGSYEAAQARANRLNRLAAG